MASTLWMTLSSQPEDFSWTPAETPLSSPSALASAWAVYVAVLLAHCAVRRPVSHEKSSSRPVASTSKARWALERFTAAHNAFLMLWSAFMCVGVSRALLRFVAEQGVGELVCTTKAEPTLPASMPRSRRALNYWMYMFYVSKYYELIDTLVLLLREKPLTTLHLWHHTSVMLETFMWNEEGWIHASIGVCFNTFVHVWMYTYFCASVLRVKLPWRRAITLLQIVQFVFSFGITVPNIVMQEATKGGCVGLRALLVSAFCNGSYLLLFLRFYRRAYRAAGKKDK